MLGSWIDAYRAKRRLRIVVSAFVIGIVSGVTLIGLPVDDLIIGARTSLFKKDAPQNIVIVALDDKTLGALGNDDAPRSTDAKLIDRLFALGAEKVYFDRTYHFAEEDAEDAALIAALKRHPGKVAFGALHSNDDGFRAPLSLLPAQKFQDHVQIVSLQAFTHPLKLSASYPFESRTVEGTIPTMSVSLADLDEPPSGLYRPDYSYRISSIPRISYIDVLKSDDDGIDLRNKKMVVAPVASAFQDYHFMPGQGYVPGSYFQVMGAHTLMRGVPINLGWLPIFAVVMLIVASGVKRGNTFDRYRIAALVVVILVVPAVLAQFRIEAQVSPALIAATIAVFRSRTQDRFDEARDHNEASGLPSIQALRSGDPIEGSLIALKIRNYAAINSVFGRSVEAELAAELLRRIRLSDPDAKVFHDGDLFLWASTLGNPLDLIDHLEGLHRIVRNGISIDGTEIDLSFNCGVEIDSGKPMPARVSNVQQAVDQALRSDELVAIFEANTNDEQWEISLLSSLERAIDNGDVWVAYQPKLDLATGTITSAEALVRWTHPERGPINPEKFIGIAEQYHRIDRITRFVLDEAIATAASLHRVRDDFSISVNISAQLLRDQNLPNMVSDALALHDFPAEKLILEITETDRLEKSSKTISMMHRLVESGVQISIDDFGTGNATIDYLRYLPAVEVKIDKSFVSTIESDKQDLLLVQSIIEMAHSLDRRVVAEGVENEEIIEILRLLECDIVQGFHISRPIPFDELLRMIATASPRKVVARQEW